MAEANLDGLPDRDKDILMMMSEFGGKTFIEVLEKTFWSGNAVATQQARDRVQKMKHKYKLVRSFPTGLMKPRNAIVFTEFGKRWANEETELSMTKLFFSPVTVWHGIYEQIAYFWLRSAGREVSRTIVKKWAGTHKHTPDLLYFHNDDEKKPVYVEVELNSKNKDRYLSIFKNIEIDKVYRVLYIFENEKKMNTMGRKLPINDKVMMISIDQLIENVSKDGKIGAISQVDFYKKIGEKK